jgi:hypothetical protein
MNVSTGRLAISRHLTDMNKLGGPVADDLNAQDAHGRQGTSPSSACQKDSL